MKAFYFYNKVLVLIASLAMSENLAEAAVGGRLMQRVAPYMSSVSEKSSETSQKIGRILKQKVESFRSGWEDKYLRAQAKYGASGTYWLPTEPSRQLAVVKLGKQAWQAGMAGPKFVYRKTYGALEKSARNQFFKNVNMKIPEITREESDKLFNTFLTQWSLLSYTNSISNYFLKNKLAEILSQEKASEKVNQSLGNPRHYPETSMDIAMQGRFDDEQRALDSVAAKKERDETLARYYSVDSKQGGLDEAQRSLDTVAAKKERYEALEKFFSGFPTGTTPAIKQ